ncbi:uncharacterized protein BYT42DRAFT_609548 [Radiomyces spectabilis]|uniref:uncharacterized protein n=1 Tax=Radiomyces spectabilis TaxID=64574 RepID=UPI00222061B5|nr:uncharacterized protein BYT42DRAFT_609548 [Radiomyces spectabilis]KAI8393778.1 hypothetical protein BYT42DRAFT_609548 [Radiomyces spectabilis]
MATSEENETLFFSSPEANSPGTGIVRKQVLQTTEAKRIIIEAMIGQSANNHYSPRPTVWPNGLNSDVLYATESSNDNPPVLVQIQYAVNNDFLHRVVGYCKEIFAEYGASPVVLVIAIHECSRQILNKASKIKSKPFFFKLPCYPWANQCFILSKESISSHIDKTPLDPVVALGSFFVEQKQTLAEHTHHDDPTIQQLYCITRRIVQNQIKQKSRISHLLRVVEDAESRYDKVIRMLDDDADDTKTKKRSIDYLEEAMNLLRTYKRQYISSPSSTMSGFSTSSARHSRDPSLEPPSSTNDHGTTDDNTTNWQYIEEYMEEIGGDRMNWEACYKDGCRKGYFKTYSTPASLKNAYNRWKNKD